MGGREHLAVLREPYLHLILSGRKTIEVRLAKIPLPPFRRVAVGDRIWLKRSGGPVVGRAVAARVEYFDDLTPDRLDLIRDGLAHQTQAAPEFWRTRRDCRYGSLIWLTQVESIPPFRPAKITYAPWLVLSGSPA